MSSGKSDELLWRETYFILFPQENRPKLDKVRRALARANQRLILENLEADDNGRIESLLVESPEDHAAVEVSYEVGEAVIEQNMQWAKELQKRLPLEQLQQIVSADARLDVAHFERRPSNKDSSADGFDLGEFGTDFDSDFGEDFPDDMAFEMLDPTCLLTVVDTLASLTGGLTYDPASGEIVD